MWLYVFFYKIAVCLRVLTATKNCNFATFSYLQICVHCAEKSYSLRSEGHFSGAFLARLGLCIWELVLVRDTLAGTIFIEVKILGPSFLGDRHAPNRYFPAGSLTMLTAIQPQLLIWAYIMASCIVYLIFVGSFNFLSVYVYIRKCYITLHFALHSQYIWVEMLWAFTKVWQHIHIHRMCISPLCWTFAKVNRVLSIVHTWAGFCTAK